MCLCSICSHAALKHLIITLLIHSFRINALRFDLRHDVCVPRATTCGLPEKSERESTPLSVSTLLTTLTGVGWIHWDHAQFHSDGQGLRWAGESSPAPLQLAAGPPYTHLACPLCRTSPETLQLRRLKRLVGVFTGKTTAHNPLHQLCRWCKKNTNTTR